MWKALIAPLASAGLLLLALCPPVRGQCEITKLLAYDGQAGDWFGHAVAIDGGWAVVGAYKDDDQGDLSGSAYVYRLDGTNWVFETKLHASDGGPESRFGRALTIQGDTIVIGAYKNPENGVDSGAAYVFRFDGSDWVEEQKLLASDGDAYDEFGLAVSLDGEAIVIGAMEDDDAALLGGSAYVFRFDGATWQEEQKLLASDHGPSFFFGQSVGIVGDHVLVGAWGVGDLGNDSGAVYAFHFDGSSWVEQQKLLAADGSAYDYFGFALAMEADLAIIGAYSDDDACPDDLLCNSGSAYVFRRSGSSWTQEQKLVASDAAAGDWFGYNLRIAGDTLACGAPKDDDNGDVAGAAYTFYFDGATWTNERKLLASDGAEGDAFGISVAVSGTTGLVGARYDDDNGERSGSAYLYDVGYYGTCDLNCDGTVNGGDIPFFVLALTDPVAWQAQVGPCCDLLTVGDANGDNLFNSGDIPGFVACLTGP